MREKTGGYAMKHSERRRILMVIFAVFLAIVPPSLGAEGGSLIPGLSPAKGPSDLGVIFNTTDLLFGLESYQAGLGAKIGFGNRCLRGLFDFTVNGSSNSFAMNFGETIEYHLIPGPISPYIGASAGAGYMTQSNITSAMTFSLGAIAGVEVFIFDFLSVFAEYALAADFTYTTDLQSSQSTFDYLIDTRMGNNAKLGIVIYLMRSGANAE
jgi:hypothetical protein